MTAFLANENISRTSVEILRENGHDVRWISEEFASLKDELVMQLAFAEKRLIVTFDADYGERIYGKGLIPPLGVIYLRLNSDDPALPANLILKYSSVFPDVFDHRFSVLSESGMRYRAL